MFGQGYIFTGVCDSVHRGEGMRGQGVCMARGCAWPGGMHGQGAYMAGGMCGGGGGACMVVVGVCVAGEGACMTCTPPRQILRLWHTVNEWAVCILLECILVLKRCHTVGKWVNPYNIRKSWFSFTMGVYEDIFIVFYIFPHLNGGTEFF